MHETQTAAGTAMELSGPETKTLVRLDWTPQTLQLEIEREKGMRTVLRQYMKDAMIKDHHYYSFKEGDRPALTQEGAHNLSSLFKTIIGPPDLVDTFHDDGHYTVRARVEIFNQSGERIATGDGICSTRESKYAYRWGKEHEIPPGVDVSTLKTRGGTNRTGGSWKQYQIANQDLPDLYNTVLKMAVKRAKVAGVRQLPLVSELFAPEDLDDTTPDHTPTPSNGMRTPPSAPSTETAVEVVVTLVSKLIERGVSVEELAEVHLPKGVERFEDLTPEQAFEIRNDLVTLLNAKIKGH